MIAMDPSLLKKYLCGEANDHESQLCERYLSDPANQVPEVEPDSDSLIDTIRSTSNNANDTDVDELVDQLQKLVPRRAISDEDLTRVLSQPQSADELGRIGKYRVLEFIASGGMGLVFKAEDPELERLVCIKTLHPSLSVNFDAKARFAREAKSSASLRNDRIVTVLDVGEHRELPYLVMQLLDGQSLRDKLEVEGKLPHDIATKITLQIAEGLRYAHELGFLHRDIKPENIWITSEGDIKLLDFGLARVVNETTNLTATGTILGTPRYMSPEQVQGNELDARSDLFSVGSVLFEMLTGNSPFEKSNIFSTMMSVANESLELPTNQTDIPNETITILQSLLKKSAEERIGSAEELIAKLNSTNSGTNADRNVEPLSSTVLRGNPPIKTAILSAVAGAAILAFGFLLFNFNDKGTLVVEADPSVNVSIENEEVTVLDPTNGKQFKITIGDHPLPSGVYQLEMSDAKGEYKLSSEVIAIRRGEKQIVKVTLKPTADSQSSIVSNLPVENETSSPTTSIPKTSLAKLPTLDAESLRRKLDIHDGQAIARNATVTKPFDRSGAQNWSIEPIFNAWVEEPNANGTLFATFGKRDTDGFVRIWNRKGELVLMIPVQDSVQQINWSPEPNVLAVVENGNKRKNIVIWKLIENQAEVIDVIPSEAQRIAWSWDGLLLALQSKTDLTFYDLVEQKVFAHSNFGIRGDISKHPLSYDRRFLATTDTEGKTVKVWDLREKKLFHIFAGAEQNQFLPNDNRIAIRKSDTWEIWDLEKFERTMLLNKELGWLSYAYDHRFEKVVATKITRSGPTSDLSVKHWLLVKHLQSGTETKQEFKPAKGSIQNWHGHAKLNWSLDDQSLVCVSQLNTMLVEVFPKTEHEAAIDFNAQQMPPTSHGILIGSGRIPAQLSKTNRLAWYTGIYEKKGKTVSYDLATRKYLPSPEIEFFDMMARFDISPNGKSMFIVGSDKRYPQDQIERKSNAHLTKNEIEKRAAKWAKDLKRIRLFSVESGKEIDSYEFDGNLIDIQWSSDSSSIIVSTSVTRRVKQTNPEKLAAAEARYKAKANKVLAQLDIDEDGKISFEEAKKHRNFGSTTFSSRTLKIADLNADGKIDLTDLIDAHARLTDVYVETETNIYHLDSKKKTTLTLKSESLTDSDICFQRGPSSRGIWGLASAKVYKDKIVLPLLDSTNFSFGGNRVSSRNRVEVVHKDKLGFFSAKTGELLEVVELGKEFKGDKLEISKDLILIGRPSNDRNSTIDSFFVLDRRDNGAAYSPERYHLGEKGNPTPSPLLPYFAVLSKEGITIYHVNNVTKLLEKTKQIPKAKTNSGQSAFAWHSTEPICASIHETNEIRVYNAQKDEEFSNQSLSNPTDIMPTPYGWLVLDSDKLVEFDMELNLVKTHFTTERFENLDTVAKFNQCVTSDGRVLEPENTKNVRLIRLHQNRFETVKISVADE